MEFLKFLFVLLCSLILTVSGGDTNPLVSTLMAKVGELQAKVESGGPSELKAYTWTDWVNAKNSGSAADKIKAAHRAKRYVPLPGDTSGKKLTNMCHTYSFVALCLEDPARKGCERQNGNDVVREVIPIHSAWLMGDGARIIKKCQDDFKKNYPGYWCAGTDANGEYTDATKFTGATCVCCVNGFWNEGWCGTDNGFYGECHYG